MEETWIQSLGQEDPLEEDWQSTPVFLSGESDGQRSLAGYIVHGVRELDMTKQLNMHAQKKDYIFHGKIEKRLLNLRAVVSGHLGGTDYSIWATNLTLNFIVL